MSDWQRKSLRGASCSAARRLVVLLLGTVAVAAFGQSARAQMGSDRYSAIVVDARTGTVLSAMNPDAPRHPASLTKMMTLYLAFEALRDRRIDLDTPVPVSVHAASMVPTKLGLIPGTRLSVEQAILGMVTLSANDAAAALGELLGGDEARFAQMMTLRARALGMTHTVFENASGLPDPNQVTTASDMALLARHLIQDFPDEYHYFSTPNFQFHGRTVWNHDTMLRTYPGADGLKTGYTEASGRNLVTSAVRSNVRLIGVVLGAASNGERDLDMRAQLDDGFQRMDVPAEHEPRGRFPTLMATAQAATLQERGGLPALRDPGLREPALHLAALHPAVPVRPAAHWGVQLGRYASLAAARAAAGTARRGIEGGETQIEETRVHGRSVFHLQVVGLTQAAATAACRRGGCTLLRADPGQVASR
jgi:D-alanyl-D-alanine carboxypeptidase